MEMAWREGRIAPPRRAAATPPGTSRRRRARGSTGFRARRHRAKLPQRPRGLHPASPTRRRPRDAWSRSRTRPPHQRSSSATPRGPRGALPRAPRYAHSRAPIRGLKCHPSLLHAGGRRARRVVASADFLKNVTSAGLLRGGSGRAIRLPSIEAHARMFYTQDDDSRRSSRAGRTRLSPLPSRRVRLAERVVPPTRCPPADDSPIRRRSYRTLTPLSPSVARARARRSHPPPPLRPPSSSCRYPPRRRTRRG